MVGPRCGVMQVVWCDAFGVCLEIDGSVVEDGSWLRKVGDGSHINLAELDAVVRGINLVISWKLNTIEVLTDSSTVFG